VLNKDGSPTPVERILIRPPESQMGAISSEQRREIIDRSPYKDRYNAVLDRESAYEILKQRADIALDNAEKEEKKAPKRSRGRQSAGEALLKSAARSIGSTLGRQIIRGIMGSLLGRR
jgi:hypothetical protein